MNGDLGTMSSTTQSGGLLVDLSDGELAMMDALRYRLSGATLAALASLAGLSTRHSRRCLNRLSELGLCECVDGVVADGSKTVTVQLWCLTFSQLCVQTLGEMPRMKPACPTDDDGDTVPRRFWGMFWSGVPGSELRLSKDGVRIAGTLVGSRNFAGECWALRVVDTEDLAALRQMRGFDEGINAQSIDAELKRRELAAVG